MQSFFNSSSGRYCASAGFSNGQESTDHNNGREERRKGGGRGTQTRPPLGAAVYALPTEQVSRTHSHVVPDTHTHWRNRKRGVKVLDLSKFCPLFSKPTHKVFGWSRQSRRSAHTRVLRVEPGKRARLHYPILCRLSAHPPPPPSFPLSFFLLLLLLPVLVPVPSILLCRYVHLSVACSPLLRFGVCFSDDAHEPPCLRRRHRASRPESAHKNLEFCSVA